MVLFSDLLFNYSAIYHVAPHLSVQDLLQMEQVNKTFRDNIRSFEAVWTGTAADLTSSRAFVPKLARRLLTRKNSPTHRSDLIAMSIRDLKSLAASYGIDISACFEKSDLMNVISSRELRKRQLNESLARFAVRIMYIDQKRNCLTMEELTSIDWHIRVRGDGPLQQLVPDDPWWRGDPSGSCIVKFKRDGSVYFQHIRPNAFSRMTAGGDEFPYVLQDYGSNILLTTIGVTECVARHPPSWGFVLMSKGSVWTSFPMPAIGTDPLLEDANVDALVTAVNRGFIM